MSRHVARATPPARAPVHASRPSELLAHRMYLDIDWLVPSRQVTLKVEGFNIAGSIKLRTALSMVEAAERRGQIGPGSSLVESSSGNLGLALAIICAERGYHFICVSDPKLSPSTARLIAATGAELIVVTEKDNQGGYLQTRLAKIKELLQTRPNVYWTNQYGNPDNPLAHYGGTAVEMLADWEDITHVFVGAGTTGTLSGVGRYLREQRPEIHLWAVDAVGSVTFGGPGSSRRYPGLGTSVAAPISKTCAFDDLVYVSDDRTADMLSRMLRKGLMFGPSTATVLAAVEQIGRHRPLDGRIVAISPDMADRYTDWMVP
jgi:2,3-diaminopropionate biosynthesis protein SbnA